MTTDYFVSFNGRLVESSRPDGWPQFVQDKFVFRAENATQLVEALNTKAQNIKNQGGMTVVLDDDLEVNIPDLVSDSEFGRGVYVPMHMIAYIAYTVKKMITAMPDLGDKGVILQ